MRAFIPVTISISAFLVSALAMAALSQSPLCVPRSEFINHLKQTYSEEPVATGVADNGTITELLQARSGDSWTIIMTKPEGLSCRVAAGTNWEPVTRGQRQRSYP